MEISLFWEWFLCVFDSVRLLRVNEYIRWMYTYISLKCFTEGSGDIAGFQEYISIIALGSSTFKEKMAH